MPRIIRGGSEQAGCDLSPPAASVTLINLSAAPLELHLATGQTIVPARGHLAVDRLLAADPAIERLAGPWPARGQPGGDT